MTIEKVEAAIVVQSTVVVTHRVADLVIVIGATIGQLKLVTLTIVVENEARHVVPLATKTSLIFQPFNLPVASDILKTTIIIVSVDFWGIETVRGQRLASKLPIVVITGSFESNRRNRQIVSAAVNASIIEICNCFAVVFPVRSSVIASRSLIRSEGRNTGICYEDFNDFRSIPPLLILMHGKKEFTE